MTNPKGRLLFLGFVLPTIWAQSIPQLRPAGQFHEGIWMGRRIIFESAGGFAVVEGDILLSTQELGLPDTLPSKPVRKALGDKRETARWPGAVMPYVIDASVPGPDRAALSAAIADWNARTGLLLTPRTTEPGYFRIAGSEPGCFSALGYAEEERMLNLGPGCFQLSTIHHELGHMAGLGHEQSRADRNSFIRIDESKLSREYLLQWGHWIDGSALDFGPYDFSSAMHYWIPTGVNSIPSGIPTGQRTNGLSPTDIEQLRRMYHLPVTSFTIDTNPSNLQIKVDGITYTAPQTFTWTTGTIHTLDVTSPQFKNDLSERYTFARWSNLGSKLQTIEASPAATVFTANFTVAYKVTSALWEPWKNQGAVQITPSADGYYEYGQEIQINAIPTAGKWFLYWPWQQDLGSRNPAVHTVMGATTVYAAFADNQPTTIATVPAGCPVIVDRSSYTSPRNFDWPPNSSHTISATPPCENWDTRHLFTQWSNAGSQSQTVTPSSRGMQYTASYKTQHRLSAVASWQFPSTVTQMPASADEFYDVGTPVRFIATPSGNKFLFWTYDITGTSPIVDTVADRPKLAHANFAPDCAASPAALSADWGAAGGLGSIAVTSNANCYWLSWSDLPWVGITSDFYTFKNGTVTYRVAPNPSASARTGAVTIGSQRVVINQTGAAVGCTYTLSEGGLSLPAAAGARTVSVSTAANCSWNAVSVTPWVSVAGSGSGIGSGSATVTFTGNPASTARTGSIMIAGFSIPILQTGQENGGFGPGIFRSGFLWLLDADRNAQFNAPPDRVFAFGGVAGDIPLAGDWNGSGTSKIGIYRPSNGLFVLDYNGDGQFTSADKVYNLGVGIHPSDVPVVGDWNGDGKTKAGLFRQGFFWILDKNGNGVFEQGADSAFAYGGVAGDIPVVGDWNGSGISKAGLFRQGFFWILDANGNGTIDNVNGGGGDKAFAFGGLPGDVPLTGDWNGDGKSKAGIFRQGFFWILDANGNNQFDGTAAGQDLAFAFGGIPGDKPVVGKW